MNCKDKNELMKQEEIFQVRHEGIELPAKKEKKE